MPTPTPSTPYHGNAQKTPLGFTKMHGLGNDFMLIDALSHPIHLEKSQIIQWGDRYLGVGFDQLLVLETPKKDVNADFACRIFNADGSEAEQCGNGLRCLARFIHENGLSTAKTFSIATKAGIFPIEINAYDSIRVTMGTPAPKTESLVLRIEESDISEVVEARALSLGNPHAIVSVQSIDTHHIKALGHPISTHIAFPNGANVGFMQVINAHHIKLRTHERGVGETHACGSNACAAAIVGILEGVLQSPVTVEYRYGALIIDWENVNAPLHMTGPASLVYQGII